MLKVKHSTIYRHDYSPPPYFIEEIHLEFRLDPSATIVTATSKFHRNPEFIGVNTSLQLNGESLTLIELKINGIEVQQDQYCLEEKHLVILHPKTEFLLQITTRIDPEENKALSGVYRTGGNYCTQCEAEGFRRITYYLDRPDVLSVFTTKIIANKKDCPVLLANGNMREHGETDNSTHYAVWHDPYPKPSYLFALVAGDLFCREDHFVAKSGKNVALMLYVEHSNKDKCDHALRSLKNAMKWDEDVYRLEYDLDIYMIVAVDDFNMGAMENKGLNVFNSKYVLASAETATDQDYLGIEGVIAHEYFHNWTGNRVTCRDWFQLSLKEGLTVFRDQEFSSDMNVRAIKRIHDVTILRDHQFREDAGPMAHPVRPDSYVEINNFYTVTVYNKGAEVIRMIHTLLGNESFHKGIDLYFKRFDGMAVTCDDFVQAMSDASGVDLEQFKLWYSQSGTPELFVEEKWDEKNKNYTIAITQNCKATPGQPVKKPFHIPVEIGLLHGTAERETLSGNDLSETQKCLEIKNVQQTFSFSHCQQKPLLSFLRGFTAPVKVRLRQSREELSYLMAYDSDLFNRWDAANRLAVEIIRDVMEDMKEGRTLHLDPFYLQAFKFNLTQYHENSAFAARALTLPSEIYMAQQMDVIEPDLIHNALTYVREKIVSELKNELYEVYFTNDDNNGADISPEAMGKRSLKNCCLSYLMTAGTVEDTALSLCLDQFNKKNNMTDVVAALAALSDYSGPESENAFKIFYDYSANDSLVVDKWLQLQAISCLDTTLTRVRELLQHKAFSLKKPNKVRSLIGTFCSSNHYRFHDDSGAGYHFLTEQILKIDAFNPQVAARLVSAFTSYKSYRQKLKELMEEQIKYISMQKNISADVYEIVKKCLD